MHIFFSKANGSVGVGRERDGVALSEARTALLMHHCFRISTKSDSINREEKMRRIKGSKQKQKLTGKKGCGLKEKKKQSIEQLGECCYLHREAAASTVKEFFMPDSL